MEVSAIVEAKKLTGFQNTLDDGGDQVYPGLL